MWSFIAILALMIPLVAVILESKLGRALATRLERPLDRTTDAAGERIAALEAEVDRLGAELHRLQEQSDFLHRLLEGKPAGRALASPDDD